MKFHNGCWLLKEGYGCFSPAHVYEVREGKREVTLCAPTIRIEKKGDTLGGINLTVRITAPMPEVIRVQTFHHKGVRPDVTRFELELPEEMDCFCMEESQPGVNSNTSALRRYCIHDNCSFG